MSLRPSRLALAGVLAALAYVAGLGTEGIPPAYPEIHATTEIAFELGVPFVVAAGAALAWVVISASRTNLGHASSA